MSQPNHKLSEQELLKRYAQDGNLQYLGWALERYTKVLLGIGLKYVKDLHTAQDLVQQVFLKALEKLPHHVTNLGGWLYMVMRNECMDHLRKSPTSLVEDMQEVAQEPISDEVHWERVMREQRALEVLNTLKDEQRISIELFYLKNKSYQDISLHTGWEINEVKSYIQNGKRNLRIKLENDHNQS